METLILKGKGIITDGSLERFGALRVTKKAGTSGYVEFYFANITSPLNFTILCENDVLSATNGGVLTNTLVKSASGVAFTFYINSTNEENIIITNAQLITQIFNGTRYDEKFNPQDVINYAPNAVRYLNTYFSTQAELNELLSTGIERIGAKDISTTEIIDYSLPFYGAQFNDATFTFGYYKNISYFFDNFKDGFDAASLIITSTKSADLEEYDIALLLSKMNKTTPTTQIFAAAKTGLFTYTAGVTYPAKVYIDIASAKFTSTMIDNILIDAASSVTSGTILLTCTGISRTSASDSAVATLTGLGVSVKVNGISQ